jgi:hypothetical protein
VTLDPRNSGEHIEVIGIFGAGRFGAALARRAVATGYDVRIVASGPLAHTALVARAVAPGAIACTSVEVARDADLLILAVPLHRFRELPLPLLAGHVVIDAMNYWPPTDGILPEFDHSSTPTSVIVRDALPPTARLVKTFNHVDYRQIEDLARPGKAPDRAALAICGDDPDAVLHTSLIVDKLGFDPVAAGRLEASAALQPGSALFGTNLDATTMQKLLAARRNAA